MNKHAFTDSRKSRHAKAQIVATTSFHRRVEIDVSHAHIFSPEPDIVEKRIENFGRWACRELPLTAHVVHRQLSESSLIQYTDKNHYVGSLSARQSCANQPPGSDAVVVLLALARPTTEWHQHIQSRRFNPCVIAAQMTSRGSHGSRTAPLPRVGAGGVLFVSGMRENPRCFLWGVWVWVVSVSGMRKPLGGVCSKGLPVRVVRRRATLPHPVGCSTIAVPGLSFRVRNGTGRLTWAMAAANLLLYGQTLGSAGLCSTGTGQRTRICRCFVLWPDNAHCRLVSFAGGRCGPTARGWNVGVAFRPLVPVGSTLAGLPRPAYRPRVLHGDYRNSKVPRNAYLGAGFP